MGGFLSNLGRAVGGHYKQRLKNKYGPKREGAPASGSSDSSPETGSGGVADIIQGAMRRKRAGKKRS